MTRFLYTEMMAPNYGGGDMENDSASTKRIASFIGRPTVFDVGIGVLYFFTSHMVIRAMYYVGVDRTTAELATFFMVVVIAAILAHMLATPLMRARLFVESMLGVPAVSVVAAAGASVALISMLPVVDVTLFYVSAVLLGLACGWIVVIWTSTIHAARPDETSFYVDGSLAVAVVAYFLFRCVSTFSYAVSQGFLLALPLVAIVCIIHGGRGDAQEGATLVGERAQALQVLVVVSAVFAIGCSIVVYLSDHEGDVLSSGLNYMVLFEVLAITLMLFCCGLMSGFARRSTSLHPRGAAVLTFCVCYIPMFLIGLVMGGAGIPSHSPDALWESNMWVLLIAIFAYDIRDSLYAVRGLAIGLMFEAMCVAQIIARMSTLDLAPYSLAGGIGLTVLYFAGVCWQLFRTSGSKAKDIRSPKTGAAAILLREEAATAPVHNDVEDDSDLRAPENSEGADEGVPSEILAYCQKLALEYGLTPREAEILGLIAMGRSAKYIAEELLISYNTTRTHIKHVYEKLNIHSKQELIDVVLFGSGVM